MPVNEQRTVGALVRRLKASVSFMGKRNGQRRLLDEAVQCIEDLAMQLYQATHAPTIRSKFTVERIRDEVSETPRAAEGQTD